jgi:hypothetical protein
MRVLICGGRWWTNQDMIGRIIDHVKPDVVIEGEAPGADTMARLEAEKRGIEVEQYPAMWNRYGRAAGPVRNAQMLKEGKPDLVIAFHNDLSKSKGTKNMVAQTQKAGIQVKVLSEEWFTSTKDEDVQKTFRQTRQDRESKEN